MDLRNCRMCGSMFQYVGDKICPKCRKALEDKLQDVKKYIDEHDRVTVMEVSEELDVPVKQIRKWIQEERLMFAPGVDTGLVCTKCGTPIESGSMCAKCKAKLKDDFDGMNQSMHTSKAAARPAVDNRARMHTNFNK